MPVRRILSHVLGAAEGEITKKLAESAPMKAAARKAFDLVSFVKNPRDPRFIHMTQNSNDSIQKARHMFNKTSHVVSKVSKQLADDIKKDILKKK